MSGLSSPEKTPPQPCGDRHSFVLPGVGKEHSEYDDRRHATPQRMTQLLKSEDFVETEWGKLIERNTGVTQDFQHKEGRWNRHLHVGIGNVQSGVAVRRRSGCSTERVEDEFIGADGTTVKQNTPARMYLGRGRRGRWIAPRRYTVEIDGFDEGVVGHGGGGSFEVRREAEGLREK